MDLNNNNNLQVHHQYRRSYPNTSAKLSAFNTTLNKQSYQNDRPKSMSTISIHSNDSYISKRYDRARSPSPTEFFRNKIENYDHIWLREHELNEFIYNGIQKFLDKQAVRDLIYAYDTEDIFVNGEEHFFENVQDEVDFIKGNNMVTDPISKRMNQVNNNNNNNKGKFSQFMDIFSSQIKVASYSNLILDKQMNQLKQEKSDQLVAVHKSSNQKIFNFFTTVLVKMFGIKMRHLAQQRRESKLINVMMENHQKKNKK